jgi:phospholipase/carboxylesterase
MNLNDRQLSLIGFSQSAMVAIHTSLTRMQPCALVIAYSCRFITLPEIAIDIKSKPNIFIIHGDADDVVPFSYLDSSLETLRKNGINTEAHAIHSLSHIINDEGMKLGVEFIKRHST